jgi:hypothetical protein
MWTVKEMITRSIHPKIIPSYQHLAAFKVYLLEQEWSSHTVDTVASDEICEAIRTIGAIADDLKAENEMLKKQLKGKKK